MAMDIDFNEYKLRCQLQGHEDDVRGICVCDNAGIATSSRDRTIRFWSLEQSNSTAFTSSKILLGHTSFVGPLAWVPPNEQFPEGGLISGGMDTLVLVWNLATGEKVQTLKGHKMQVTGVTLDGSDVVSASVDCTIRRWKGEHEIEVWEAHKAPIQAVRALPSGELITGSSDSTIKLWKGSKCTHTFTGHTDTVRGLAIMPDLGILSASHDGSIRLWALTGEVLLELVGHTAIVYSVDAHKSGLVASGSEDGSAKIWKDGVCVQSIDHPGCVWDVKFLENGDIVTACSDGVARVWTVHQDRTAESHELEAYASLLSQYKGSRKRVGGLKLEELPGLEALQAPGTKDGQTIVVREGDNGVAYAWNGKEQKWDKIGEVIDGPDDGIKRPVHDGVQYDYVFDVDIGDGEPIRKLPYNRSDNAYDTADKWLLRENLPLSYRQQVVEFILQNSGQKDFILDSSFRDPYTGSNAYVPGQSSMPATSSKPTFKHIPKKGMLVFDAAQFDGILKKISEFNNSLLSDPDQQSLSISDAETSRLGAIAKILKDTSHYHTSKFSADDISLLLKLLKSWPVSMMFPVIDVLRMVILHPDGSAVLKNDENDIFMELIKKVTSSPLAPNLLTSIRAVVNLFKNSGYHLWLQKHRVEIFDAFASCYSSPNKNVQVSYSTLVLKVGVPRKACRRAFVPHISWLQHRTTWYSLALQDVKAEEETEMKSLSDLAFALGMNYVFAESWAPQYGNAILSKWPIKRSKVQKSYDDQDFRNVLNATIDVPRTGELNFYCTQLDHLDENWRMKQIDAIVKSSDEPMLWLVNQQIVEAARSSFPDHQTIVGVLHQTFFFGK